MKKTLLTISALAVALHLHAQNNPGVNQADTTRLQRDTDKMLADVKPGDTVPPLYEEESEDVGPQSILRKKKHQWFRGSLYAQAFYTDNMLYQEHNEKSAGVAVTSIEAAFMTPPCITALASYRAEVGYRHQFFNYFGNDNVFTTPSIIVGGGRQFGAEDFDFDSSTAFANLTAQTKHYQFGIGFDYTRLLGFEPWRNDDYDEFYSEAVPRWSVQRNFRVCDKSMVSLAYLGSYHFTDEERPLFASGVVFGQIPDDRSERWEHTFLAAYTMALPCDMAVQPFYRFQFNDFAHTDNYIIQTVGLSAGWYPCANFAVRGFVGYNWSDASDSRAVEYTKLDAGGGVNVTVRF
ncbi:MAG TPA: hypothetical protein VK846_07300 [Candidatus Limnocylindria bacterium]|nr:hypothetical protein [Candidatus Limnocylindria bacterium]